MKAGGRFPQSYENVAVRKALDAINAQPTLEALDALLEAALTGGLVVDVTGSTEASGTRIRTIASTAGEPVLPLFTSMKALRDAVGAAVGKRVKVQAIVIPSREALALIKTADFVAVQFNPGTNTMVVARSHIESALSGP
jgi:SseB protein N-terminal domain